MGEFVMKNCGVFIGDSSTAINVTDHVRSVTITYNAELHDRTAMGSSARKRIAGLKDGSVTIEFNQDLSSTTYDKTLWNSLGSTATRLLIKAAGTSASTKVNPRYYGPCIMGTYNPITGTVGDLSVNSVTFQFNGLLNRAESS